MYDHLFYKRAVLLVLGMLLFAVCVPAEPLSARLPEETQQEMDKRMAWWREAKFGMFIHWGLYAIPAGQWKGRVIPGVGEWIMEHGRIPKEEYAQLQHQFHPVKFDAAEWVSLARRAGMKYIVITSKHHDGFCLFDSKLTDYDIMGTAFKRDVLKELAEQCAKQGIRLGFYYSIMDWYHPQAKGVEFPRYAEHMRGQLKELLTNYGKIGVLWFDGEWIGEWTEQQGRELEKFVRGLQPELIVNNRVGKRGRGPGDFGTPEQEIPATGSPGWDWETCMTMNNTWGYRKDDHNWKSVPEIIRKLVDIVSKGGNFLLNVGPTQEGIIPQPSVERLLEVGQWLERNGESIYGTSPSPFHRLAWGRCTQKPGKLYLHVFHWPADGRLVVPGLDSPVKQAYLLVGGRKLGFKRAGEHVEVELPALPPDKIDTVVVLAIEGEPRVSLPAVVQSPGQAVLLHARDALLHGHRIQYEVGGGKDNIGFWTDPNDYVQWGLQVVTAGDYEVRVTYACPNPAAGSEFVIDVCGQQLSGKVKGTGSWVRFHSEKLGQVKLSPGRQTLTVKAKNRTGEGVMNLQAVLLAPMK